MPEPRLILEAEFVLNHQELYEQLLTEVDWDERMRARKTATFGTPYNYSGMTYDAAPMHPRLVPVVDRLEQRLGFRPSNCLLNYYPDGEATMGFHSDSEVELVPGTGVTIVSLGAERSITFRRRKDKEGGYRYTLTGGSLLYMPAGLQQEWRHAILKQEGVGGRISLTFRCIRESS